MDGFDSHSKRRGDEAIPESDDDLRGGVKVAEVPADDRRADEAREHRLALVVARRRDDQVRHPRAHLSGARQQRETRGKHRRPTVNRDASARARKMTKPPLKAFVS